MAPAPPRPDPPSRSVRLVFSGHYGGAPWSNVMWLFLSGSGEITTSELNALAAECRAKYAARFMVWLRNTAELQSTTCELFSAGDSLIGIDSTIVPGSHSTGVALPSNVACCVSWRIAVSYRGGHPRSYLSGLSQDQTAAVNTWSTGFLDVLRPAAASFHTDLESITGISSGISSVQHGVVSFVRDGAWRTPPVFYRITGSVVDQRIDTQRRRLGPDVT